MRLVPGALAGRRQVERGVSCRSVPEALAHREQIRESNRRWVRRQKARAPRRQRNPMLYLGMDYVMLKLGEAHVKK